MYEDSVIKFIHGTREVTPVFAKWIVIAEKNLPVEAFPELYQIEIAPGSWKYLVEDDRALTALHNALNLYGIRYGPSTNVELAVDQKQWVADSGITDRRDAEAVIARAERIGAATDVADIKVELLRPPITR